MTLGPFPVDDATLDLIDLSLNPEHTGQSSLHSLLDLLSGHDPSKLAPVHDDNGRPCPDIFEYPDPVYSVHDCVRSLVAEVRRLRSGGDV